MSARGLRALPVPALLGTTMFFWGAAFTATDVALDHTTPAVVALVRTVIGAVALLVLLPVLGGRLPRTRREWVWAFPSGAGATALSLMGLSEGIARAGPAIASVLLNTAPFFATVIAYVALRERVTALRGLGLLVGFVGILLIVLSDPGDVGAGSQLLLGIALTLVGAIGYAAASVVVRHLHTSGFTYELYGFTFAQFLWGAALLLPYALLVGDPWSTDWGSGSLWTSFLFLGLGSQLLAFVCFFLALERWTSAHVLAWSFLPPVVAGVIEALRGNLPAWLPTLGMLVVIAGVIVVNLPRAEARPEPSLVDA